MSTAKEEPVVTKAVPRKDKICVWTFPEGSNPAVRVHVDGGRITTSDLMTVVADTLNIRHSNLTYFGLFRGITKPTKRYGMTEIIYLPCKFVLSIQKWSFDAVKEEKALRTDAGALHLLSLQTKVELEAGKLKPTPEEIERLREFEDPTFPCDKQYVEFARQIKGYGTVHFNDCVLDDDVKIKNLKLKKGTKLDIVAQKEGMWVKSGKHAFFAPWKKIRRWTQVEDNKHINFEIFLTDDLRFDWLAIETEQAPYLVAVISELVHLMKKRNAPPEFKLRSLENYTPGPLTWKEFFLNDVFSMHDKEIEPYPEFDIFDEPSDESSDEEDVEQTSKSSLRAKSYAIGQKP